jgi:hypothetical protein
MKCVNCSSDALYEYKLTTKSSIFYCEKDLPKFLFARKNGGTLSLTPSYAENLEAALSVVSPEAAEAVTESVEEPKKAVKKTAK